jgi:uncharacterized alpha-E superfamily protein
MLSRVADNLYWMSRYLERAEHTARLLAVHMSLSLDLPDEAVRMRRRRLLALLGLPDADLEDEDALFAALTFDLQNPNSICACVQTARENARQVREQINLEMWQEVNELYLMLGKPHEASTWSDGNVELCEEIIERTQLFSGITDATMLHGQGWLFIKLGAHLERANATARFLASEANILWVDPNNRIHAGQPLFLEWQALLRSCAAFEAYSKVYTFDLQPTPIAEFVLLNTRFPRSVAFTVTEIQRTLGAIAEETGSAKNNRASRIAGRLRATLDYGDIHEVVDDGVVSFLEHVQRECHNIHTAANRLYITYPLEEKLVA